MSLRTSIRALGRERAFSIAVTLTLALGLGGCLAIFTIVNGVLLAPLPYHEPDRLVLVWMTNPQQGIDRDVVSYPMFRDWRDQSRDVFRSMATYSDRFANLVTASVPQEVRIASVSAEFFDTVGVRPRLGRAFAPDDFVEGSARVVLGHGLWQRAFGGRPDIVGSDASIDGRRYTIVGVLPPAAEYPADAELWVPLVPSPESNALFESRGSLWLPVMARLADGVRLETAQQRMALVQHAQNAAYPDNVPGTSVLVTRLGDDLVAGARRPLWLLQGAVALVLLIACANASNLLLARATARERETATRIALGAGRPTLAREWLTETMLLTAAGAAAGLLLAAWVTDLVVRAAPAQIPRLAAVAIDWPVIAAGAGLTLVTGLLVGMAPMMRLGRLDIGATLKDGGRTVEESGGRARVRLTLVAAQLSLALVLLVGAGLLLRSFAAVLETPNGFDTRGVLTARVALPATRYRDRAARLQFWDRLRADIAALPTVTGASGVTDILLSRLPNSAPILVEGRPDLPEALSNWPVAIDSATPGYFDTVGMRVLRGRDVADADDASSPGVVVVNEALAMAYFGTPEVVGRRIAFASSKPTWLSIVGVVSDARRSGPELDARPETYMPLAQRATGSLTLVVRTEGDVEALVPAIREIVRRIDPEQAVSRVGPLEALLDSRLAERRLLLALIAGFAGVALLLAGIGIYGVMAYTVGRRRHELGLRAALGASRADLLRLVLRQGAIVTGAGVLGGLVGALAAARLMEQLLYRVQPVDPVVFALVTVVLAACALVACWLPARRAARIDPVQELR